MQKQFFIVVFMLLVMASKAQFSLGVRENISTHGTYFEPPSLQVFQTSYIKSSTGLVLSYVNMNNAGIQAEINYAQKGWREVDDSVPGSLFTRDINYLEIPILSHFEIGSGKVRSVISAGPYIAFKLSETSDSTNFSRLFKANQIYNHYEQEIRSVNMGIKVGLGLRYNITDRLGIYVEGIYNIDVAGGADIFKDYPNDIQASRLKEIGGTIGLLWHVIPQQRQKAVDGYTPKEDL